MSLLNLKLLEVSQGWTAGIGAKSRHVSGVVAVVMEWGNPGMPTVVIAKEWTISIVNTTAVMTPDVLGENYPWYWLRH